MACYFLLPDIVHCNYVLCGAENMDGLESFRGSLLYPFAVMSESDLYLSGESFFFLLPY